MPDYNLLGSQDVLEELQEGRTRELLLLLQDSPVPEVVDPLNIQGGLSERYETDGSGDFIITNGNEDTILDAEDGSINPSNNDWTDWTGDTGTLSINSSSPIAGNESLDFDVGGGSEKSVTTTRSQGVQQDLKFSIRIDNQTGETNEAVRISNSSDKILLDFELNGDVVDRSSNTVFTWIQGTTYDVHIEIDWEFAEFDLIVNGTTEATGVGLDWDNLTSIKLKLNTEFSSENITATFDDIIEGGEPASNDAFITDRFDSPTTAPADFKAWNAIQARDVTTGGSTSADPVEFEILDSTGTALNPTRIPKARIADEPFTMRNRVYSENAGSNGQSDYQIATTGGGGDFGIPVLTVVSVKKNGSVLDSANWSFDGTDTVTIDTSNVTIASGDTIDIKYDFDVFDSTLQPRAYLSRESTSETSPSISHFRYEYVI